MMAMIKTFYMDYCEAVHPNDEDAQDQLFEDICDGTVKVQLEEMQTIINAYKERCRVQEVSEYKIRLLCANCHFAITSYGVCPHAISKVSTDTASSVVKRCI